MKTLYLSDLDGTLLQPDVTLSDTSRNILRKLTERGTLFTVATARTPYSVVPILGDLIPSVPGILMNGVLLYDFQKKRITHAEVLPAEVAYTAIALMEQYQITGFAYTYDQQDGILTAWYENLDTAARREFHDERVTLYQKPFRQVDHFSALADQSLVYLALMDTTDVLDPLADALRTLPGIHLSYYQDNYRPGIWFLEVSSSLASKEHTTRKLRTLYADQLGFDRIVGFGDNLNDLPLFAACDQAYAVENARNEVKEAANGTIGYNTEDAVAHTIHSLETAPDKK